MPIPARAGGGSQVTNIERESMISSRREALGLGVAGMMASALPGIARAATPATLVIKSKGRDYAAALDKLRDYAAAELAAVGQPGMTIGIVDADGFAATIALGWAEASGARDIYVGVNALDYSGYPDCRPEFITGFEALAELATKAGVEGAPFRIRAPLQMMTKADVVREGARLGLDMGVSWSCYDPAPGGLHCGLCDSCRLRHKGFEEAGVPDPTAYAVTPPAP